MLRRTKKQEIKNFDADMADDRRSTASAGEATGLMYAPPRNKSEQENMEDVFPLQSDRPEEVYIKDKYVDGRAFDFPRGER